MRIMIFFFSSRRNFISLYAYLAHNSFYALITLLAVFPVELTELFVLPLPPFCIQEISTGIPKPAVAGW